MAKKWDVFEIGETRIPLAWLNKKPESIRQFIQWGDEKMKIVQFDNEYVYVVRGAYDTVMTTHITKTKGRVLWRIS